MRNIIILSLVIISRYAHPTTMLFLDLEDITNRSEAIIRGRVKDVESRYNEERTKIFTYSIIEVRDTIKGKTPPVFTVRTYGGQVGDICMKVPGMPEFKQGEEVFLFIKRNEDFWHIVGMAQGKYSIIRDKNNEEFLINDLKDIFFKKVGEDNRLEDLHPVKIPNRFSYPDLVSKVKRIVESQGNKPPKEQK